MCIIIVKKKGVDLPSRAVLKQCYKNNPDGCGFMYHNEDKVIIDKGYKSFENFYEKLRSVDKKIHLKNQSCVLHFRIATAGKKDKGNCHPFPISDDKNKLKATFLETDIGIAHNGTIVDFVEKNSNLSDTMWFIIEFLFPFYYYDEDFVQNEKMQNIIENTTNSKFAFLDNNGNIYLIGNFIEENGLMFSNSSYKDVQGQTCLRFYTDERYEDALFEGNSELISEIEITDFEESLSNLTILEKGEKAISKDKERIYIGGDRVVLGFDRNHNLYEIDYRQQKLECLEENVEILW